MTQANNKARAGAPPWSFISTWALGRCAGTSEQPMRGRRNNASFSDRAIQAKFKERCSRCKDSSLHCVRTALLALQEQRLHAESREPLFALRVRDQLLRLCTGTQAAALSLKKHTSRCVRHHRIRAAPYRCDVSASRAPAREHAHSFRATPVPRRPAAPLCACLTRPCRSALLIMSARRQSEGRRRPAAPPASSAAPLWPPGRQRLRQAAPPGTTRGRYDR